MPELPEVETVKRAFELSLPGQRLVATKARRRDLRFPIPLRKLKSLDGLKLKEIRRRGKYLLFDFGDWIFLSHLGMSGNWRMDSSQDFRTHDHLVLAFEKEQIIYNDPRRFGFVDVFEPKNLVSHPRLSHLGVEPLTEEFDGAYLQERARGRESNVKSFLMNAEVVVGVGNIYAVESLYLAGIHPKRSVSRISKERWDKLSVAVKEVLSAAIKAGGSSIKDFRQSSGEAGGYQQKHRVYGRGGQACQKCGDILKDARLSGRATVWCPSCQR